MHSPKDAHTSEAPTDERADGVLAETPEPPPEIDRAIEEAVSSIEAREREAVAAMHEPPASAAADAPSEGTHDPAAAVTEALITAKRELMQALEQTQKEAAHLRDRWLRSAADLENAKKRAQRERDDAVKFANERLLRDFLPVFDDLERALLATERDATKNVDLLADGVKLVIKKFLAQVERHGVAAFDAKGETFDPNRHEAVQQVFCDIPVGRVVEQLQRGFLLHDRLLRAALVTVSMGQPAGADTPASESNEEARPDSNE